MWPDSATRLYASSIAIVSRLYSIVSAAGRMMATPMMTDMALGIGGWIMLGLGFIVLVHGSVLLTPAADRLRQRSGPLMALWAVIMLLNRGVSALISGWGMPGSRMGDSAMATGMGWDAGMVAIAVLMLASGLIMSRHAPSDTGM